MRPPVVAVNQSIDWSRKVSSVVLQNSSLVVAEILKEYSLFVDIDVCNVFAAT